MKKLLSFKFCFIFAVFSLVVGISASNAHDDHEDEEHERQHAQSERDDAELFMRIADGSHPGGGNPTVPVTSAVLSQAGKKGGQAGAGLTVGEALHKIIFGGPKCNECEEYVDSEWDHRYTCAEGHWYWRCDAAERAFHKWCVKENTDCGICQGEGCRYCNSSY